jgi:acetyltransferase-like isoleucine patch superfamily enzyme
MARIKTQLRTLLIDRVAGRLRRTRNPYARERLWQLIRRLDDRHDSFSRRLLKELHDIEVGRLTYGAYRIDGSILAGSRIGAFCSIAPGVRLGGIEHPVSFVSTHPFLWLANRGFLARDDPRFEAEYSVPVTIADDVWLGANALVANGVTVGRGAVVGAGAVVTKDVEPYAIVAGVPARPIGSRFDADLAAKLAAIDWPSWPDDRLRAELDGFYDPAAFAARHHGS